MKFNTLFLSLLINFVAVYAKADYNAKSFAIGSTHYCKNNKLSKTDKLYYAAIVCILTFIIFNKSFEKFK